MVNRYSGIPIAVLALLCALAGCNGESTPSDGGQDAQDGRYPDPAFVWEASGHSQTASDAPFLQERPFLYRTTRLLPDLDVRTLAVLADELWAGTAGGLVKYHPAQDLFEAITLSAGPAAVVDLAPAALADGRLVVGLENQVELYDPAGQNSELLAVPQAVSCVATDGDQVWAGTAQGLYRLEAGSFAAVDSVTAAVNDAAVDSDGRLWLATSAGLIRLAGADQQVFDLASGHLPDDDVRAVCALENSGVLAGCASGAALVDSTQERILTPGIDGLPYGELTSVAAHGDLIALGHKIGATVIQGDYQHKDHYHSLRWIPDETVTAVALQPNRRWIATPAGITRIELVETTLEEKAALFESLLPGFWRLDFVSDTGRRDDPWDLQAEIHHHDHDNDGLWSQMQIVAWSYATAATGDDSYCDKARRAMGAMMQEIDLPAVTFEAAGFERGFVCRSFVRDDEGQVFTSKEPQDNWHLVEDYDGHDYYWKDDTSSDETTGHFFGYPVFYDLCARDQAERDNLAEHAGALARYIIDGGFLLIDLTGERTSHGVWDPDTLAVAVDGVSACIENGYAIDVCIGAQGGMGWLNSIEILGHMLAAYHMTGDTEFYDAYDMLITEHRYDEVIDFDDELTMTVIARGFANHSDHELAMLAYHTLIRYEPDPERRQRWLQSLLGMYEYEILERNPLWSAIIAGFETDGYHLEEALQTLREWPEDWRDWLVDNSHRQDVRLDGIEDRFGKPQFTTVLPYDEIRTMKWNGNPYIVTAGGDGRSVQGPWPWLLPYWMYRYHGVIE